jgi:uncharacterized membrane-anchored protein YhcB (DUF1043 family)
MNRNHDWLVALVAVAVSIAINVVIYAYAQGKQEHRIETLEKQMADMREDWKAARDRVEAALKEKR